MPYTSGTSAILAPQNKQIDYVLIDKVPALNFVLRNTKLALNNNVNLTEESYAFVVTKGDKELLLKVNGKFDEIVNKYYSNQKETEDLNFFQKEIYIIKTYTPALLLGLR